MEIKNKNIIEKVIFNNNLKLEIGDRYDEGYVVGFVEEGDNILVILEDGKEGWGILLNKNGEMVEED